MDEDEQLDVGDIALEPPPISFSDIRPCAELLPQGGTCRYSVTISNNTSAPLRGTAWSLVEGSGLGFNGFTTFEASTQGELDLVVVRGSFSAEPFGSEVVAFQFTVPSFAPDGATFCTRAFLGLPPNPLVNITREGFLFCIAKGTTGFRVMSVRESKGVFASVRRNSTPPYHAAIRGR